MMDGKTLRNKLVGSDDERAVSPVIGVILMVAITVILAAVIATLVMDFGESVDGPGVNAGVQVNGDGTSEVTVSVSDMGSADGVAIVNDSGGVEAVLDTTGESDSFTSSGDYTVQAYKGSSVTTSTTDIDIDAQENSVIGSFTVP